MNKQEFKKLLYDCLTDGDIELQVSANERTDYYSSKDAIELTIRLYVNGRDDLPKGTIAESTERFSL